MSSNQISNCALTPKHIAELFDYLQQYKKYYPDMTFWTNQVLSDIRDGRKNAIAVLHNGGIQGLAIVKKGMKAKLCHLSLDFTLHKRGLGSRLLHTAISKAEADRAIHLYLTASEEVSQQCGPFFNNIGFIRTQYRSGAYRPDKVEFVWETLPHIPLERLTERIDRQSKLAQVSNKPQPRLVQLGWRHSHPF
jgi:GNAT superfamily N-acetyltransferase